MTALFERDGDRYVPTGMSRGPWDPTALPRRAGRAHCWRGRVEHVEPETADLGSSPG